MSERKVACQGLTVSYGIGARLEPDLLILSPTVAMVVKSPVVVTLYSNEILADWVGMGDGTPPPPPASTAVSETPGGPQNSLNTTLMHIIAPWGAQAEFPAIK